MSILLKCALRDSSAISKSSHEQKGCQCAFAAAWSDDRDLVNADTPGRFSLKLKCCSGHLLAGW